MNIFHSHCRHWRRHFHKIVFVFPLFIALLHFICLHSMQNISEWKFISFHFAAKSIRMRFIVVKLQTSSWIWMVDKNEIRCGLKSLQNNKHPGKHSDASCILALSAFFHSVPLGLVFAITQNNNVNIIPSSFIQITWLARQWSAWGQMFIIFSFLIFYVYSLLSVSHILSLTLLPLASYLFRHFRKEFDSAIHKSHVRCLHFGMLLTTAFMRSFWANGLTKTTEETICNCVWNSP